MFSIDDLPPRWSDEVATFRRRGQEDLAIFLESYLSDLEAEMLSEGREVPTKAGESLADYTVAQVAEMFDRRPQTVRDWIRSGRLRAYLLNGREYRVTRAALEAFQEEQRNGPARADEIDMGAWRNV